MKIRDKQSVLYPARHQHLCLAVLFFTFLLPLPSALASDKAESTGSVLRTLIPAVAYGTTFYLHDSAG